MSRSSSIILCLKSMLAFIPMMTLLIMSILPIGLMSSMSKRNRLMDESFDACEKASADIYSIGYDEMMAELKRMRAC